MLSNLTGAVARVLTEPSFWHMLFATNVRRRSVSQ
jgi:hypothetical protein